MRKSKRFTALALVTGLALVAAACGDDDDEEGTDTTAAAADTTAAAADTTAAPTETTAAAGGDAITACEVTDVGGVDDLGFNQSAFEGVTRAEEELGVTGSLLESTADADYAPNIQAFIDQECSVIITVGFLLAGATATAAKDNPDQQFAIIDADANDDNGTPDDFADDINLENVRALNFSTDQPSFLAGYLAAGMTETGTVATYGGINIPPVTIFMTAFLNGVNYYNAQKGTEVEVLGWDGEEGSFAGNFQNLDDGKRLAQGFFDEGADIIFPVAGQVGLGSSAFALENGEVKIIGVDKDQYISNAAESSVYLTSVLKNIEAAVFDTISNVVDSGEPGEDYLGDYSNNGVGLAPYYDYDAEVPDELKAEIDDLTQQITDGTFDVANPG